MKRRSDAAKFGILVYDGVEPIDIGGTVGVLSMARRILPNIEYVVLAAQKGPVRLAGGLIIMAEADFDSAPACDVVVVTGGPGWQAQCRDQAMLDFLRRQPPRQLASVCTGALILAAAGILDGKRATTRRLAVGSETISPQQLLRGFADVEPIVAAVVEDGGVVTGGGVALSIDAMLYLIGRLFGDEVSGEIARSIEYDRALAQNRACLGYA